MLLATAFSIIVLHAVGLEIAKIDSKIKSTMALYSSTLLVSRSELVASERSSLIPTASAVRYYTAMQAFERLLWFPLILSGDLECLLLSLCNGGSIRIDTQHSLDLRDLLLIDCTMLRSCHSVDEHSMLSYLVSSCAMELRPID